MDNELEGPLDELIGVLVAGGATVLHYDYEYRVVTLDLPSGEETTLRMEN